MSHPIVVAGIPPLDRLEGWLGGEVVQQAELAQQSWRPLHPAEVTAQGGR
jgi:hypothetical protein